MADPREGKEIIEPAATPTIKDSNDERNEIIEPAPIVTIKDRNEVWRRARETARSQARLGRVARNANEGKEIPVTKDRGKDDNDVPEGRAARNTTRATEMKIIEPAPIVTITDRNDVLRRARETARSQARLGRDARNASEGTEIPAIKTKADNGVRRRSRNRAYMRVRGTGEIRSTEKKKIRARHDTEVKAATNKRARPIQCPFENCARARAREAARCANTKFGP
ncbi:hypothetical protein B0H17DRAFT_1139328 [Mycena rosella]|uniref:Uncharacterized protein n=1 Tax=Mycena rosella TaxID=1033263 RepID=A0AAD7D841_MYCRO|nr:hypothetical protein B0H17DRAFT_1139328 [Mycena rosella]